MKKNLTLKVLIISVFFVSTTIVGYSMLHKELYSNELNNELEAIKFLNIQTYPYSINENMFWENGDAEFARMKIRTDANSFINDIKRMKKIKEGVSEDFEFAFLSIKENKTDTIYASISNNLWTLKEKGKFVFYKDEKGEIKNVLQEYSSFFSNCW